MALAKCPKRPLAPCVSSQTYKNLPAWYKELREYRPGIPVICVANKIDVDAKVPMPQFPASTKTLPTNSCGLLPDPPTLGDAKGVRFSEEAQHDPLLLLRLGRDECECALVLDAANTNTRDHSRLALAFSSFNATGWPRAGRSLGLEQIVPCK